MNFAARIVTKKRRHEHISAARKALGWLSFGATIDYRDIMLMHSIIYQDQGPQRIKNIVTYRADVSERATRSTAAGQLETSRCRLETTRMMVPVRAARAWNGLDRSVRDNSCAGSFRRDIKAKLLSDA